MQVLYGFFMNFDGLFLDHLGPGEETRNVESVGNESLDSVSLLIIHLEGFDEIESPTP